MACLSLLTKLGDSPNPFPGWGRMASILRPYYYSKRFIPAVVNASLNWASLVGILLALYALPAAALSLLQLYFNLNRRADTSPAVISKLLVNLVQFFGRLGLVLSGSILFFQGWRLDPILQFMTFMLSIGVIIESGASVINDYGKWRNRLGRAKAVIIVTEQPTDQVDV